MVCEIAFSYGETMSEFIAIKTRQPVKGGLIMMTSALLALVCLGSGITILTTLNTPGTFVGGGFRLWFLVKGSGLLVETVFFMATFFVGLQIIKRNEWSERLHYFSIGVGYIAIAAMVAATVFMVPRRVVESTGMAVDIDVFLPVLTAGGIWLLYKSRKPGKATGEPKEEEKELREEHREEPREEPSSLIPANSEKGPLNEGDPMKSPLGLTLRMVGAGLFLLTMIGFTSILSTPNAIGLMLKREPTLDHFYVHIDNQGRTTAIGGLIETRNFNRYLRKNFSRIIIGFSQNRGFVFFEPL